MLDSFKRYEYLKMFQTIDHSKIRFRTPMILKMYGALNKVNMRNENRYILCNFLDQNSKKIGIKGDIYKTNNEKSLNQLLILAFEKAKESNLIDELYQEYIDSINAINSKSSLNT